MSTRQQRRLRYRFQTRQVLVLTLVWLCLVGQVSLVTVVGGLLVAWLVTIVFPMPAVHYYGRLNPWGIVKLLVALLRDLATASWRLARFALGRRPITPGIVRVDLRARSDLYQVTTAGLVSVVPGTIVVDARRTARVLYLHVFNLADADTARSVVVDTLAVERRLVGAVGSPAEIRAVDDRAVADRTAPPSGREPTP